MAVRTAPAASRPLRRSARLVQSSSSSGATLNAPVPAAALGSSSATTASTHHTKPFSRSPERGRSKKRGRVEEALDDADDVSRAPTKTPAGAGKRRRIINGLVFPPTAAAAPQIHDLAQPVVPPRHPPVPFILTRSRSRKRKLSSGESPAALVVLPETDALALAAPAAGRPRKKRKENHHVNHVQPQSGAGSPTQTRLSKGKQKATAYYVTSPPLSPTAHALLSEPASPSKTKVIKSRKRAPQRSRSSSSEPCPSLRRILRPRPGTAVGAAGPSGKRGASDRRKFNKVLKADPDQAEAEAEHAPSASLALQPLSRTSTLSSLTDLEDTDVAPREEVQLKDVKEKKARKQGAVKVKVAGLAVVKSSRALRSGAADACAQEDESCAARTEVEESRSPDFSTVSQDDDIVPTTSPQVLAQPIQPIPVSPSHPLSPLSLAVRPPTPVPRLAPALPKSLPPLPPLSHPLSTTTVAASDTSSDKVDKPSIFSSAPAATSSLAVSQAPVVQTSPSAVPSPPLSPSPSLSWSVQRKKQHVLQTRPRRPSLLSYWVALQEEEGDADAEDVPVGQGSSRSSEEEIISLDDTVDDGSDGEKRKKKRLRMRVHRPSAATPSPSSYAQQENEQEWGWGDHASGDEGEELERRVNMRRDSEDLKIFKGYVMPRILRTRPPMSFESLRQLVEREAQSYYMKHGFPPGYHSAFMTEEIYDFELFSSDEDDDEDEDEDEDEEDEEFYESEDGDGDGEGDKAKAKDEDVLSRQRQEGLDRVENENGVPREGGDNRDPPQSVPTRTVAEDQMDVDNSTSAVITNNNGNNNKGRKARSRARHSKQRLLLDDKDDPSYNAELSSPTYGDEEIGATRAGAGLGSGSGAGAGERKAGPLVTTFYCHSPSPACAPSGEQRSEYDVQPGSQFGSGPKSDAPSPTSPSPSSPAVPSPSLELSSVSTPSSAPTAPFLDLGMASVDFAASREQAMVDPIAAQNSFFQGGDQQQSGPGVVYNFPPLPAPPVQYQEPQRQSSSPPPMPPSPPSLNFNGSSVENAAYVSDNDGYVGYGSDAESASPISSFFPGEEVFYDETGRPFVSATTRYPICPPFFAHENAPQRGTPVDRTRREQWASGRFTGANALNSLGRGALDTGVGNGGGLAGGVGVGGRGGSLDEKQMVIDYCVMDSILARFSSSESDSSVDADASSPSPSSRQPQMQDMSSGGRSDVVDMQGVLNTANSTASKGSGLGSSSSAGQDAASGGNDSQGQALMGMFNDLRGFALGFSPALVGPHAELAFAHDTGTHIALGGIDLSLGSSTATAAAANRWFDGISGGDLAAIAGASSAPSSLRVNTNLAGSSTVPQPFSLELTSAPSSPIEGSAAPTSTLSFALG